MALSNEERTRRQKSVDDAAHGSALEGLTASADHRADAKDFVNGVITRDELIQRGLDRASGTLDA